MTKASGLELNVIVNSEREDWINALISDGIGVSILPQSSSTSGCFRNVKEFKVKREVELVLGQSCNFQFPRFMSFLQNMPPILTGIECCESFLINLRQTAAWPVRHKRPFS